MYWDPVLDGTIPDDGSAGVSAPLPAPGGISNGIGNGSISNGNIRNTHDRGFRDGPFSQRPLGGGGGGGGGGTGGGGGGGAGGGGAEGGWEQVAVVVNWDAAMAEAVTVLEWDVAEEVGSEANRQELCRKLLTLVRNVLRGDPGHRKVRDNNPAFYRSVGR